MLWQRFHLLLLCLLVLLTLPHAEQTAAGPARALRPGQIAQAGATTTDLAFVASLGGNIATVAISGTLAFAGEGAALAVLDVSNPAAPVRMARLPLPGLARDIQLASGLVYIADDQGGLQVVDVRDPAHPALYAGDATVGPALAIQIVGHLAYLACGDAGLLILDVGDPAHPSLRGSYAGTAWDVSVAGSLAAIVDGDLRLLDVGDPAHPSLRGSYTTPADDLAVQLVGTNAYIADANTLRVVGVSDPANPVLLGSITNPGPTTSRIEGIRIVGTHAYVLWFGAELIPITQMFCGMGIVDVSDPGQLVWQGQLQRPVGRSTCGGGIQVIGDQAYVADGDLQIVNVGDPAAPAGQGHYRPLRPQAVQVQGSLAYIADQEQGLRIVDMGDPAAATLLGSYDPFGGDGLGTTTGVQVVGDRAYLTTVSPSHPHFPAGTLWIVDVSNPVHPTLLGSYPATPIGDFQIVGGLAYLVRSPAGFPAKLEIVDVSDPSAPHTIGDYRPAVAGNTAAVSAAYMADSYAYVVARSGSGGTAMLQVLNVSNPMTPTLEGSTIISPATDLQVAGTIAYLAQGDAGLGIFDVQDAQRPVRLAGYATPAALRARISAGRAYLARGSAGVQILDIGDPRHPAPLASYDTPGDAQQVQAVGDTIYVIDGAGGLQILRYATRTTAVIGSSGGTLVSPPDTTSYQFPAGAFDTPARVTHTIRSPLNLPPTGALAPTSHAFEITAAYSATGQIAQPSQPYTITVSYTPAERGPAIESTLGLYFWDGSRWVKEPSSVLNQAAHTIRATPNHFSLWAVLGETRHVYLPLVAR